MIYLLIPAIIGSYREGNNRCFFWVSVTLDWTGGTSTSFSFIMDLQGNRKGDKMHLWSDPAAMLLCSYDGQAQNLPGDSEWVAQVRKAFICSQFWIFPEILSFDSLWRSLSQAGSHHHCYHNRNVEATQWEVLQSHSLPGENAKEFGYVYWIHELLPTTRSLKAIHEIKIQ